MFKYCFQRVTEALSVNEFPMISKRLLSSILVLAIYMGIIFYLSSLPGNLLTPEKEFGFNLDSSIKHFFEFAVLGFLMAGVFWQFKKGTGFSKGFGTFSWALAFSALYGASDEMHQYFVPTRCCTFIDFATDVVGSLTGVLLFLICIRIYSKLHK